jgi:hypothetical protein
MEVEAFSASLVYSVEDQPVADRLYSVLLPHFKNLKMFPAKGVKPRRDMLVLYVGSFDTNLRAKSAFKELGLKLEWEKLHSGSYLIKVHRAAGKTIVFLCGKDRAGTAFAVEEFAAYYFRAKGKQIFFNDVTLVARPQIMNRWFWPIPPASAPSSSSFREAVVQMIRQSSRLRFNAIVLDGPWSAAAVTEAQWFELRQLGSQHGLEQHIVLDLAGSGGFRVEGNPLFSLQDWLERNPSARAVDKGGKPHENQVCLEKQASRDWFQAKIVWILCNLKIDGIMLQGGSGPSCECSDCRKARKAMGSWESDHIKDAIRAGSHLTRILHREKKDLPISFYLGSGFDLDSLKAKGVAKPGISPGSVVPESFQHLADYSFCLWNLNQMLENQNWPPPWKAPARENLGVLRLEDEKELPAREFMSKRFKGITDHLLASNLTGVVFQSGPWIEGDIEELNRLILAELIFNPSVNLEPQLKRKFANLYGGEESSRNLVLLLDLLEDENGLVREKVPEALAIARKSLEASDVQGRERWQALIRKMESWQ